MQAGIDDIHGNGTTNHYSISTSQSCVQYFILLNSSVKVIETSLWCVPKLSIVEFLSKMVLFEARHRFIP